MQIRGAGGANPYLRPPPLPPGCCPQVCRFLIAALSQLPVTEASRIRFTISSPSGAVNSDSVARVIRVNNQPLLIHPNSIPSTSRCDIANALLDTYEHSLRLGPGLSQYRFPDAFVGSQAALDFHKSDILAATRRSITQLLRGLQYESVLESLGTTNLQSGILPSGSLLMTV
jgi:hypothetical protein